MDFSKLKCFYQVNGDHIMKTEIHILNNASNQTWQWFAEPQYREFLRTIKPSVDEFWDVQKTNGLSSTATQFLTGSSLYIAYKLQTDTSGLLTSCLIPKDQREEYDFSHTSGNYSKVKLSNIILVASVCSISCLPYDIAQSVLKSQIKNNNDKKRSPQQLDISDFFEKPSTLSNIDSEKNKKTTPDTDFRPLNNSPLEIEFEKPVKSPLKINDSGLIYVVDESKLSTASDTELEVIDSTMVPQKSEFIDSTMVPQKSEFIDSSLLGSSPVDVDAGRKFCSKADNENSSSCCAMETIDDVHYVSDEDFFFGLTSPVLNSSKGITLCHDSCMIEDEVKVRDKSNITESNDKHESSSFKTTLIEKNLTTKSGCDNIYLDDETDFCDSNSSDSNKSQVSKYFDKYANRLSICKKIARKNLESVKFSSKSKKVLDDIMSPDKSFVPATSSKDPSDEFQVVKENQSIKSDNVVKSSKSKLIIGPWISVDKNRKQFTSTSTAKRKLNTSPTESSKLKKLRSKLSRKKKPVVNFEDSDEDIFKSPLKTSTRSLINSNTVKQIEDNFWKICETDDSDLPPAFDYSGYQSTLDNISRKSEQKKEEDDISVRNFNDQSDDSELPPAFDYYESRNDTANQLEQSEKSNNILVYNVDDQIEDSQLPPAFDYCESPSTSEEILDQNEKENDAYASNIDSQPEIVAESVLIEKPENQKASWIILEEIYAKEEVDQLSEEHLLLLLKLNEKYLKDLFGGMIQSDRHQGYIKGGMTRVRLLNQVFISLYTDKQVEFVLNFLQGIFCKNDNKYYDYVFKVLLTECLIKLLMDFKRLTYEDAEEMLYNGRFKDIEVD